MLMLYLGPIDTTAGFSRDGPTRGAAGVMYAQQSRHRLIVGFGLVRAGLRCEPPRQSGA
jgi:hypothetical protein